MPSDTPSNNVVDRVLQALPTQEPGLSYGEIHERVGMWSKLYIRNTIMKLRKDGRVHRVGPHEAPLFYREAR